ncbi:MAG: hypothetical protein QW081_04865 [Desulfurococcaceae archaeon]
MKGVSGIVATGILLALTIAGGVLLYSYITRYLTVFTNSADIVITNAYYIKSLNKLYVTVRNVGLAPTTVTGVEVILVNRSISASNQTYDIPAGGERTIEVNVDLAETPLYVVVRYDRDRRTDPYTVRVFG